VEVFVGDLANPEAVSLATAGCDTVLHLGALIPIPYSYRHPREFVTANVEATLNVLEAARSEGVRRVVHTSTSEVYGTAQHIPISETHRLHPQSPYAASKVGADQLALSFVRSFGLPVVVARPFNTFGPRQSARAVIPAVAIQALAGRTVELGTLDTTRDFLFVRDTARGILACGRADGVEGVEVNLGTGEERSVGQVVDAIGDVVGRRLDVVVDEARLRPRDSEVERLVADVSRARDVLGWEPATAFADGLRETVSWFERSLEAYRPELYAV
jgi:dTDP-glucose 4,6-dehydratase